MPQSRQHMFFFLIFALVCLSNKSFAAAKPFPCQFGKVAEFLPICLDDDASIGGNKDTLTKGGFTHVFDIFVPVFIRPAVKSCEKFPCGINTVCTDIDKGGRSCSCIPAFVEEPGKFATDEGCTIEKTCENRPCGFNTDCTNIQGGGTYCTCKNGYFVKAGRDTAEDGCISPCEITHCNQLNTICTASTANQRTCSCIQSYEPIGGDPAKNGCKYTPRSCRSPYKYNAITKSCYYYSGSRQTANYASAQEACKARSGGNLASINNANEHNQLVAMIVADSRETWIGLDDIPNEMTFRWNDGSPYSYKNWAKIGNQPNDGGHEDCVEIRPQFGYLWNDHQCHHQKAYICETAPV